MIKIDAEFKALIPPLSPEEREQLEANILQDGCRDPLVVWNDVIVDGHNRFEICAKHKLQYDVKKYDFDDRDDAKLWIIHNQLGRRNLIPAVRVQLVQFMGPILAAKAKANQIARKGEQAGASFQNSGKLPAPVHTEKELAKMAGVSHDTMFKATKVLKEGAEDVKQDMLQGKTSIHKAYVETTGTNSRHKTDSPLLTPKELAKIPNCVGMYFARQAIAKLEQITKSDSEREAAFQHVKEWIDENK